MVIRITRFKFGKILNQFRREFSVDKSKDMLNSDIYPLVVNWFKHKFNGHIEYTSSYSSVYFQDESDATLFLLKYK